MRLDLTITKKVIFCFLVMIIINVLNLFVNMDYLSLAIYFVFLFFIYKQNSQMIIKYLFMFVMFTYHIISVFLAENTVVYFNNLLKTSYHSGAFLPLLTSYMLVFLILLILEQNKRSNLLNAKNIEKKGTNIKIGKFVLSKKIRVRIFTIILILTTIFIIFRLRNIGFYSMNSIDRFAYRDQVFNGIDEKFYTYIAWFLPIPLMGLNLKMKKLSYIFFGLFCFYLIWVGDKFGSLFSAFYFFVLIGWGTKNIDKRMLRKIMILITTVVTVLMIFISAQVYYERGSWSEVPVYFNNRLIGGQSDLWWGVYSKEKNASLRVSEFGDEVKAIISQPDNIIDYNFGIYKMMRVTAPNWVVNNYLSRGARFAASTQATLFYYFKYIGLYVGSILMAVLYFFVVNSAINAYRRNDLIRSVIYTMLISKSIQLTTMSDITMLGNTTTLLGILILIILYFVQHKDKSMIMEKQTID